MIIDLSYAEIEMLISFAKEVDNEYSLDKEEKILLEKLKKIKEENEQPIQSK